LLHILIVFSLIHITEGSAMLSWIEACHAHVQDTACPVTTILSDECQVMFRWMPGYVQMNTRLCSHVVCCGPEMLWVTGCCAVDQNFYLLLPAVHLS